MSEHLRQSKVQGEDVVYPSLDIAVQAALALPRKTGDVPTAKREYVRGGFTGMYVVEVIPKKDLVTFTKRYAGHDSSYTNADNVESRDEYPHGGGCKIQQEPVDYKHPALQGPNQMARAALDRELRRIKPGQVPIATAVTNRSGEIIRYRVRIFVNFKR